MNDRPLPTNIEAEQALLGALLVDNAILKKVAPLVSADAFAEPLHALIFGLVEDAIAAGQAATAVTLRLPAGVSVGDLSGAAYLARLTAAAVPTMAAEGYARVVAESGARRRIIYQADRLRASAYDAPTGELAEALVSAVDGLRGVNGVGTRRALLTRTMFNDVGREPRKDWLVRGLLGLAESSAFYGAPGSGKSAIVEDMSLHIAAGRAWFHREVVPGAVLYVAAERPDLVKRRAAAFRIEHDVDDLPFAVLAGSIDLRSSPVIAEEIIAQALNLASETRQPIRLVVVDTYSRALAGGDENSPKDSGTVVMNLAKIHEATGAHVCLLHHVPADGPPRMRGHGSVLGALDVTILVEKIGSARAATVTKANDGGEGERVAFDLKSVVLSVDERGNETTAPIVVPLDESTVARTKVERRLSDRQKLGLDVLRDLCADGKPLPAGLKLPSDIRAINVAAWREELFSRGVLDPEAKNPREDFARLKRQLLARQHIAERESLVWNVAR